MTAQYSLPPERPAPVPSPSFRLQPDTSRTSYPLEAQTSQKRRTQGLQPQTALNGGSSEPETFLDDVTPIEGPRGNFGGDEKDPHDLTLSPKHVTRASVVDNMLLSLDEFSNLPPFSATSRIPPSANLRYNVLTGRRRANTFSSDASSDNESRTEELISAQSPHRSRRSNSNSHPHFPRSVQTVPSLYEEEEPQAHSRIFDSQRAFASYYSKNGRRSGKSSESSSVDLGHSLSGGRLGSAGSRRSRSFDFGASGHGFRIFEHTTKPSTIYSLTDQAEAAPTPIVHAGPNRSRSPARQSATAPLSPIYDVASMSRNSIKSSKGQYARKSRAGIIGAVSKKNRGDVRDLHDNLENLPPMPTYFPPPPQNRSMASRKPSLAPTDPALPLKERPGFFRRVFGSKYAGATNLQAAESNSGGSRETMIKSPREEFLSATPSPARPHKHLSKDHYSASTTAPKEQQTVAKKTSTFFRRRRKSMSGQTPVPPPLSLSSVQAETAQPSPVSSLRQVMDPYLADDTLQATQAVSRDCSPQGFRTANTSFSQPNDATSNHENGMQGSASPSEQAILGAPLPAPKHDLKATVPHQDLQDGTFLADSSGTEEPTARSSRNASGGSLQGRSPTTPRGTSAGHVSEKSQAAGFPVTSITSSRVPTPSSGAKTSPSMPEPAAVSKTARPSKLTLKPDSSKDSGRASSSTEHSSGTFRNSPLPSGSDISIYKSAPSTPLTSYHQAGHAVPPQSPTVKIIASPKPIHADTGSVNDRDQALKIFENRDENLDPGEASAWLGDAGDAREHVRTAYMKLFEWRNVEILSALRGLCARIALKGETQQVDRMLEAFSKRWCECNGNHGFKSSDVVHTICYSVLLLNTDLHLADIDQKMTRSQFIRNTLPTIRRVALESTVEERSATRAGTWPKLEAQLSEGFPSLPTSPTSPSEPQNARSSIDEAIPVVGSTRFGEKAMRENVGDVDPPSDSGPLVTCPFVGSMKAWECQIEQVLKRTYTSIARERLPLFGAKAETLEGPPITNSLLNITSNMLRRSPSTLSKAASEQSRARVGGTGRWMAKGRSRPSLHPVSNQGSARTSLDDGSSAWSPSMSSTWSKASLGKTLTCMSVDSFGGDGVRGDYQKSIGFANALSQAIIREDSAGIFSTHEEGIKATPLLDDDSLELNGAPWAKEGSLKHKQHLDGVDKRAKSRNWNDCFAVIEKGWVRLFSFSLNAKSLRHKARDRAMAGGVVGGGNWMDNADEVWKFLLRHTIASALPDPGYSQARPYVWALSLPTGAVHLFQVGTPDIVKEFVSTANYWSARLSKEPMMGGISNMEYGWSDAVVDRALISIDANPVVTGGGHARASIQSSLRNSIDQVGSMRPKLPGDKMTVHEWSPPQQSMMASQLMEVDQLRTLQIYVKNVEDELAKHNELRVAMQFAFSIRHPNTAKAMANWEKKSSYLLREIVKFKTYVDSLLHGQKEKERVLRMRGEEKKCADDSRT